MTENTEPAVEIDPATYVQMFEGRLPLPAAIAGVCGRVVRGKSEDEFTMLAFASGRRLAWITGPDGLRGMIGRSGADTVLGIGKAKAWLPEKIAESMRWRLVVLPQAVCARADWTGVFGLIEAHYPEVAGKLLRWRDALQDPALAASIDPALTTKAVKDHADHPDHMGIARYRVCDDTATSARLFLWHSLGLNEMFTGDGWMTDPDTKRRETEYLTANVPLASIPSHRTISLVVEP